MDFPRLQIALIAAAWIAVGSLMHIAGTAVSLLWWMVVLGCLVYQCWWIFPYTKWHRVEVASTDKNHGLAELTILTSNVLMDNRDAGPLIELVKKHRPHVLATLETDQWWESQLDTLEDYPHRLSKALDNKYGMHIYSRIPLSRESITSLVEEDVPSMAIELQIGSKLPVTFHLLHPRPPAPGENSRSTERDVELLVLAKHLQDMQTPLIVSGDLNDVAWSRTTRLFRRLSGLLDIRVGRGMFNTFHADFPFLRWPLDHIFVSGHFSVVSIRRLAHIGSDHFPVLATLACSSLDEQEPHLDMDNADLELAEQTLSTDVAADAANPELPPKPVSG